MKYNDTQKLIYSMLVTNTGEAMGDSGGAYGRHWERNIKMTIDDFAKTPAVSFDVNDNPTDSSDINFSVSLFHYLPKVLELDDLCEAFNALPCTAFDGDTYGIDKKQSKWLKTKGLSIGSEFNSYNGEGILSQVIQGTNLTYDGLSEGDYVLLQIHQGCDVRGGYTDAKLFKYKRFQEFIDPTPEVYGTIDGKEVSTAWDGWSLKSDGEEDQENSNGYVPVTKDSVIKLSILED